jgi:hypothetical protein
MLGSMAALGAAKMGAILWETTFPNWALLHVLVLPFLGGGLLLGIGLGHDHVVSDRVGRRVWPVGLLILSAAIGWGTQGGDLSNAWVYLLPVATVLIGIRLGQYTLPAMLGTTDSPPRSSASDPASSPSSLRAPSPSDAPGRPAETSSS